MFKVPHKLKFSVLMIVLLIVAVGVYQTIGGSVVEAHKIKKLTYYSLFLMVLNSMLLWSLHKKQKMIFYLEGSLDALELPITTTDLNMKWVFVNKLTESLLVQHNLDKKSVIGKHCSNWKADICGTENCGVNCLRKGKPRTNYNQEYPDSPSTYMQVDTNYILDDTGKKIGHVEVVTNIDAIHQLSKTAEILTTSSDSFISLSEQLATNAQETSDRSNAVATASEEMSANMNSLAAAMEETNQGMNIVASSVQDMSTTIDEIAKNSEKARSITDSAVKQGGNASKQIKELGKSAEEIEKVTAVISEISEQTNLLALNATIEAARAGEAGKGFAVVANEIKELANQTSSATCEIRQKVESIQKSTEGTVVEIGRMTDIIKDINDIVSSIASAVEEQSTTTNEMSNNVIHASQGLNESNENIAQSSTVSREVAEDIAMLHNASSNIANSSAQLSVNAKELSALSKKLSAITQKS